MQNANYILYYISDEKFIARIRNSADKFPVLSKIYNYNYLFKSFPFSGYANAEATH